MAKPQKPKIDEPTRRIAERLLSMPPKPHKDMKLGQHKAKATPKTRPPTKRGRPKKHGAKT
jgi:hypothetical protein